MEEVLWDESSPHYYSHFMALPMSFCGPSFEQVVTAFKNDTGVEYSAYGEKCNKFIEVQSARMYQTQTKNWLTNKLIEDISSRLTSKGGYVLDLGCGNGISSISVAEAFPEVTVYAVDCDKTSMDKARTN